MSETQRGEPRRVVIVSRVKRNPYVRLLKEGLDQPDLALEPSISDTLSLPWLWRRRHDVDVLHVHWLDLLVSYPTWWWSLKRLVSVVGALVLAKISGMLLVYTVHNVWQHEGQRTWATRWANWVMFRLADAVHVHDAGTARELAKRWGRHQGVHVIPHGNYVTAYPNTRSRQEARARLGVADDRFVFAFIGRIRPYKGLEDLIEAFVDLDEERAVLVIAGEAQEPRFARQIKDLAADDERIILTSKYVPEDALQDYFGACDMCVLPYRHVTTSGAAILSFSFGVPIVAPAMGCFGEMIGANERGLLYAPGSITSLREAMRASMRQDTRQWRQACRLYADEIDWQKVARQHAAMYEYPRQESAS